MDQNGRFEGEIDVNLQGGSFSRLLFSAENPPLFSSNTPKILSFGDFPLQIHPNSSKSTSSMLKQRNGSGQEPGKRSVKMKKKKKENKPEMGPTPTIRTNPALHAKARREKIGGRITVLQQLVSPYGKMDTASVLHEAMGYIRFLEDQVKVLSSPYLQYSHHSEMKGEEWTGLIAMGQTNTGLCLVPLQCLINIDKTNSGDFLSTTRSKT